MKLKNSYILLIVMAIFLLISIGSVCANENITTDEVGLADDGTDVVLADGSATQKIDTKIDSKNVKISEKETKKIEVTVKDKESKPIKVSKENLTVTEDKTNLNFTYSNNSITINSNLAKGNHSLLITYLGNDVYKNSTKNIVLSIFGTYTIDSSSTVNVNQTQKVEVPFKLTNGVDETKDLSKNNFTVKVTYKDGNQTKTINTSELNYDKKAGKLLFDAKLVDNISSYSMTITYKNNRSTLLKGITLKKVRSIRVTPIIGENYYQDGNFTFKITDYYTNKTIANENITISGKNNDGTSIYWDIRQSGGSISLNTAKKLTTNSKGIVTLKNVNFYPNLILTSADIYAPVGKYALTFSGDNMVCNEEVKITIKKVISKISVETFSEYYGTSKKIKIVVVNSETKKPLSGVTVFFNVTDSKGKEVVYSYKDSNNTTVKVNKVSTDSNGAVELPANNLAVGKYSVYALLNSTSDYGKSSTTKSITIKQSVTYTISQTGIITVKSASTGKAVSGAIVILKYDNNKDKMFYAQTDKNGKIKITTVGKHRLSVSNGDSRYSGATVTKTISNKKITAKCSAPKVTDYYKGDKTFTVKLTNNKKSPIYDAKLNIKVYHTSKKYALYKANTYVDGKLRLSLDGLNPGTYKVEITSGNTKNFALKKVTSKIVIKKAPTKLTPKQLTAKKGTKTYFKVTVKNTKTKKVIKGVKVKIKVYTGKKYKTYTVKTNSKGIANLNVKSLKVGSHKVVVSSGNKYCVAKTAKSTIKITKK